MPTEYVRELREICDRWHLGWQDPPIICAHEAKESLLKLLGNALVDGDLKAFNVVQITEDVRALRRMISQAKIG